MYLLFIVVASFGPGRKTATLRRVLVVSSCSFRAQDGACGWILYGPPAVLLRIFRETLQGLSSPGALLAPCASFRWLLEAAEAQHHGRGDELLPDEGREAAEAPGAVDGGGVQAHRGVNSSLFLSFSFIFIHFLSITGGTGLPQHPTITDPLRLHGRASGSGLLDF